jgi:hypothetical protein
VAERLPTQAATAESFADGMTHKFKIGQAVTYHPAQRGQDAPRGIYQITQFLPQRDAGQFEYRIRSVEEGHERVASESELHGMAR